MTFWQVHIGISPPTLNGAFILVSLFIVTHTLVTHTLAHKYTLSHCCLTLDFLITQLVIKSTLSNFQSKQCVGHKHTHRDRNNMHTHTHSHTQHEEAQISTERLGELHSFAHLQAEMHIGIWGSLKSVVFYTQPLYLNLNSTSIPVLTNQNALQDGGRDFLESGSVNSISVSFWGIGMKGLCRLNGSRASVWLAGGGLMRNEGDVYEKMLMTDNGRRLWANVICWALGFSASIKQPDRPP